MYRGIVNYIIGLVWINLSSFILKNNYLIECINIYGGIVNYLWSTINSVESGEEDSGDSAIIGDYETPSAYKPREAWPRRHPDDDDLDYEPSDNKVYMHISLKKCLFFKLIYTLDYVLCVEWCVIPTTTS
jgi:hypothetical protein